MWWACSVFMVITQVYNCLEVFCLPCSHSATRPYRFGQCDSCTVYFPLAESPERWIEGGDQRAGLNFFYFIFITPFSFFAKRHGGDAWHIIQSSFTCILLPSWLLAFLNRVPNLPTQRIWNPKQRELLYKPGFYFFRREKMDYLNYCSSFGRRLANIDIGCNELFPQQNLFDEVA